MTGRADERAFEPPAPETGPAVTSANLAAQAEAEEKTTAGKQDDTETKKSTTKRGGAKN